MNLNGIDTLYISIIEIVFLITLFIYLITRIFKGISKRNVDEERLAVNKKVKKDIINAAEIITIKKMMDEMLLFKFEIYITTSGIRAGLQSGKGVDKTIMKQNKNEFYSDIVSSISPIVLDKYYQIFSRRGLILYIHHFYLYSLNKLDTSIINNDIDLKEVAKIYKDK
jgi:hypothetical protein